MKYEEYLKSKDWKTKRKKKLSKKRFCSVCGCRYFVDIHHYQYKSLFDITQQDLVRLCRICHFTLHTLLNENRVLFQKKPISIYELRKRNHLSQFTIIKRAIKQERNMGIVNENGNFIPEKRIYV